MANIYVRSTDGNNSDNGSTWALAKATIPGALAIVAAGDTIYVSKNHVESNAGNWTLGGTYDNPIRILCVDDTGDPAPPTTLFVGTSTGGKVGTNSHTSLLIDSGYAYIYGIYFWMADAVDYSIGYLGFGAQATNVWVRLEKCTLRQSSTYSSTTLAQFGSGSHDAGCHAELIDCVFRAKSSAQSLFIRGRVIMRGGSYDATDSQLDPFISCQGVNSAPAAFVEVTGMDLSALGSSSSLVLGWNGKANEYLFRNCKLGASVALYQNTGSGVYRPGPRIRMHNCDSADTNYRMQEACGDGSVYQQTGTLIRTGGASNGTTTMSWKTVSTALAFYASPLTTPEIVIWNDTTGSSKTVTVEILRDSATNLTDGEIWLEVDYLGTSGFPLITAIDDAKADILATAADQTTSSATWDTTGMSNPNKQKLSVTFTPQEKGYIHARVKLAKASTTVYVDPLPTVS